MSVLKVTDLQEKAVSDKDVVEVGQVRMSNGGTPVLIVDARNSPANGTDVEPFVAIRLNFFDINKMIGCESAEEIVEGYPILLDAELTYKEAK